MKWVLVPKDFDWRIYLALNSDVRAKGLNTEINAFRHYLKHGKKQGRPYKDDRLPKDFDWRFYLEVHVDLTRAGFHTEIDAIHHYLVHGKKEVRSFRKNPLPDDFNWVGYFLLNPILLTECDPSKDSSIEKYTKSQNPITGPYHIEEGKSDVVDVDQPIFLFYHIWAKNDWHQIFTEQINEIKSSGLWDNLKKVFINISGTEEDQKRVSDELESLKVSVKLVGNNYEFPTLQQIREISAAEQFKGIYIHAKSVSYPVDHPDKWKYHFWRQLMDYQILKKWKICYRQILFYDLVGTLFQHGKYEVVDYWENWSSVNDSNVRYTDHFSGNFFWFDSGYFSTLPELTEKQRENRYNAEWYPFAMKPRYYNTFQDFTLWCTILEKEIQKNKL